MASRKAVIVVLVAFVLLFFALVYRLRGVLTPILMAWIGAYILNPWVRMLETHPKTHKPRMSRSLATTVVFFGALALIVGLGAILVPGLAPSFEHFFTQLPDSIDKFIRTHQATLSKAGIPLPKSLPDLVRKYKDTLSSPVFNATWMIAGQAGKVLLSTLSLLMVPVFAFYMLHEFDGMFEKLKSWVPTKNRSTVFSIARDMDRALRSYLRGQVTVMILLAFCYAIAYSIAGVPAAIAIAVLSGMISFIPYLGGFISFILALLLTLSSIEDWNTGWSRVGAVVIAYAVVQAMEGLVITPRVMSKEVGLSPLWVLVSLLVFGELFGLMGVLFAVPAAALFKVGIARFQGWYKGTDFYGTQESSALELTQS